MSKVIYKYFLLYSLGLFIVSCETSIPKQKPLIYDEFGLLSKNERNALENRIVEIERKTTSEFCVYIIDSTPANSDIENYAKKVFNQIELGKKGISNGILILVSMNERAINISLGFGMEWLIDKRILDSVINHLKEAFSKRSFFQGISQALSTIDSVQSKYSWSLCDKIKEDIKYNDCIQKLQVESLSLNKDILIITTSNSKRLLVHFTPYMMEVIKRQEVKKSKYIYMRMLDIKEGHLLGFSD